MRKPSTRDRLAYGGGVSPDDLDGLLPAFVRLALHRQSPGARQVFVEVERDGAYGVIRAIDHATGDLFVDFGLRSQWWLQADEVRLVEVRYE